MTAETASQTRPVARLDWRGIGFMALGLILGGLLIVAGNRVYAIQGGLSSLAALLPLGYAFGAGMVATANPCGVLLLPSLVAFYLGRGEASELSAWQRAGKALLLGVMATLGFVTLFAVVGLIIGMGGRALAAAFFEGAVRRSVRGLVPYVHRLSAAFLLGAGIFVVDYWLKGLGIFG